MHTRLVIGNYNYSSWSLRAWLALRHTGVDFQSVRLPLDTPEFEQRIGELSPTRRVPVLHHEGLVIWDTLAICEYLAERFPAAGLWPDAQSLRALARSACAEMHAGFAALRAALPLNCRARGRNVAYDDAVRADVERVCALWEQCRAASGDLAARGPWLFGTFTNVDCFYVPVALRFCTYRVGLVGYASKYVAAALADPVVGEWLAHAREEPETIAAEEVGA